MFANTPVRDLFGQYYIIQTLGNGPELSVIKQEHFRSDLQAMRFIRNLRVDSEFWRRTYHAASLSSAAVPDFELKRRVLMLLVRGTLNVYKVKIASTERQSLSEKGIDLLKSIEQLATKPYDDQTGKEITSWIEGATIGYGHLISKSEWDTYKNGITESLALTLFKTDLTPFVDAVRSTVTFNINQNEFDALVLLVFNIGQQAFSKSSVLKLINDPKAVTTYSGLEAAWKAWNKSQGKVNNGLINRRKAEWDIYSKGVYKKW